MKLKPQSTISCFALLATVLSLFAFVIPRADDPLDNLINTLQKWTTAHPQEKIYLHMDKPYYGLGDTIWFKGYVVTGGTHQLSAISGSVYVDLINEQDSLIKSLKLPASGGMVMGDFTLTDELKQGNYRLRAYTQWMRNAGEEYFFDKTFTVGSVFSNNVLTKANYQYKDVNGKSLLTATLNYTDDAGKPLANKNVQYRIMVNKDQLLIKNFKTDAYGNVPVSIANDKQSDLTGAYIRTVIANSSGKDVIKDFPIKANLSQSDVQFFPESGNLVNSVVSRIAFKAVGIDGLGISIGGKIVDNENRDIADINTLHAGMGSFFLRPEAGKTYTAKVSFADGSVKNIALPKTNDEGYVLSVFQPAKDSILVRVGTRQASQSQPVNLNLMVQAGGEIITAQPIKVERAMTSFWLDRRAFPSGIVQFTLFNQANQPLNERIVFIRSNDQLQLDLKADKSTYKSKEPVYFTMDARDSEGKPAIGNYSVSVIDESKVPSDEVNESSIFSNLLLTSDLKGYVEKPNYYFTNITGQTDRALDNLMLTQGYRRFTWKDMNNSGAPQFPKEGYGINIAGHVQTLGNKPLPNATVTLLSVKAKMTQFATTDAEGRFKFDGIVVRDSIKFSIQARTTKNSDKLKLIIDNLPKVKVNPNPNIADISVNIPELLKTYIDAGKKQDDINERMGRLNEVHRLRQVNIKAAKDKKEQLAYQWGLQIPEGHADKTLNIKEEEMEKFGSLGMYFAAGAIPNVRAIPFNGVPEARVMTPGGYVLMPVRVILNGRLLSMEEAVGVFDNSYVECTDIVKIEAVISNRALRSMLGTGDNPALLIYTKPIQNRTQYNPSIANITPKGFNKAREFYLPKYDRPGANKLQLDMRSTVYWNPYLKTGADGKATFNFFNADGPGRYRVVIEGIDSGGQLGRAVFHYQVEGEIVSGALLPKFGERSL